MMPIRANRLFIFTGASLLALLPAAGSSQQTVQAISAADKQEGAKVHPQLLAEFGGVVTGPQAKYVESVGKGIAVQSGLGNAKSDFTVTLLNSPVNNAFAIPGGYVYTTRQLTALMNNEAELAGVLGHEIGHVAAEHGKKRQSAANQNALLGALGTILSGVLLGDSALGQLAQKVTSQGSQLLTLRYSRKQETEADTLGVLYLKRAGYDPRAMSTVLQSLANQTALDARIQGTGDRVPEWASTHPDPASRVREALKQAGTVGKAVTNRDAFLNGINGVMVGDDPKQGMIEGRKFTHPDMRLAFEAPAGFYLVNGTQAVTIGGQSGKGEFTTQPYSGNLETYINAVLAGLTEQGQTALKAESVKTTTVNGIPAAYGGVRVNASSGTVDVLVFAYEFAPNQAFHFLTIAQPGGSSVFAPMFQSLRRIDAAEAGKVKARKLQVVTVKSGDTLQSLAARMAYTDYQMDRLLVLNGLAAGAKLVPGQRVKLVVY